MPRLTLVGTNITTTSGPDGRYRLPVAPPGTRVLSVTAADYASLSKSVVIAAGREVTANLTLKKAAKVLLDWHSQQRTGRQSVAASRQSLPYFLHP